MKTIKLPSGNYRIQYTLDGKRKSHTFDHRPTQKEINQIIYAQHEAEEEPKQADLDTFYKYAEKYISIKENVLSPSTIRTYEGHLKNIPKWFTEKPLNTITQSDVQSVINEIAGKAQSKTVRNYNGFIMSIFKMYLPDKVFKITLPQKKKPDDYIPTTQEIKKVLDQAKGTKWYIPIMLGCYGLRRSEILPLTLDDISDDFISINKTKVINKNGKWEIKEIGKTSESLRRVPISPEITKLIRKQGFIYDGHPNELIKNFHKLQKKAGVPPFKFHLTRHYFCTELSQSGYSDEDIMALGGWSTDYVMKKVYRHQRIKENEKAQKKLAKDLFNKIK